MLKRTPSLGGCPTSHRHHVVSLVTLASEPRTRGLSRSRNPRQFAREGTGCRSHRSWWALALGNPNLPTAVGAKARTNHPNWNQNFFYQCSKPHTFKPQRTNIAPCYNAYQQSKTCRPNGSSFCTVPALGATTFFACFGPKSPSLLPKPTTQPSPSPSPSFWT